MNADTTNGMARSPRNQSRERGTALIEFTLVLPLLLVLTVAAVDFGRAFFIKNMLHQASREGVRLLAVSSVADSALVRGRVLEVANASGVTVSDLTIEGADAAGNVRVTVEGEFNWIFPGVFNLFGAGFTNPMTLTATTVMHDE
jgi:Flp pilus assembly protein TadG